MNDPLNKLVGITVSVPERILRASLAAIAVERNQIKVWPFGEAPSELRDLSTNGGDEDWLALVPREVYESHHGYIPWLEGNGFGRMETNEFTLFNGDMVFIGVHS